MAVVPTFAVLTPAALAAPAIAASSSGVLYDGSSLLAAGQIPFSYQKVIAGHVTVIPDPLGGGFNVMRFAVADSDRPYSGASNPRADFETPAIFGNGSDLYSSIKFMIPTGFPQLNNSGFFQIAEFYGPPYGGSPTIGIDLFPGSGARPVVSLQRDAAHGYDRPWTSTASLDAGWHTITIHSIMSTSASVGEVQIWFDGQPQTFSNGSTTINYATLGHSNWDGHTPNILNVNQYRSAGAYPGTVVTYHAAAKVGTTLAAVDNAPTPVPQAVPQAVPAVVPPTPAPQPVTTPIPAPPPAVPLVHKRKHHRSKRRLAARFAAPVSSRTGRTVTLDAGPSTGAPTRYLWTVGQHTIGTRRTVHVTFGRAGLKRIRLTVTDAKGHRSSVIHSVRVHRHGHRRRVAPRALRHPVCRASRSSAARCRTDRCARAPLGRSQPSRSRKSPHRKHVAGARRRRSLLHAGPDRHRARRRGHRTPAPARARSRVRSTGRHGRSARRRTQPGARDKQRAGARPVRSACKSGRPRSGRGR